MNKLQFTTNAITKAEKRTGPDGREYLVAPGVALIAGVVGNEYVPAEEIAKVTFGFNGRPLPLHHPMQGDSYISANSPELDSTLSVGRFWAASFDGEKLRGEYWVDVAKAQAIGGEALALLTALQSNRQVETSTAYGRDFDPTPGEWNGKPYAGIARNLVPDHVAVLVNERGKCSLADGCGLLANSCGCGCSPQVAANESKVDGAIKTGIMIAFYLSPEAANRLALDAGSLPAGSEPITPSQMHVTLAYLGKTDEVQLNELDVTRQLLDFSRCAPSVRARVGGVGIFNKDNDGKHALWAQVDSAFLTEWRRQLVSSLYFPVANDYSFTPHVTLAYVPGDDPVTMPVLPEQELIFDAVALSWGNKTTIFPLQGEAIPVVNSNKENTMDENKQPGTEPATNAEGQEAAKADVLAVNAELATVKTQLGEVVKLISDLGGVEKVREVIQLANANAQAMAANAKREKDALIAALVGNSRCVFSKEDLLKFDIDALGKLAASLQPLDYSGRSFAANRREEAQELVDLEDLIGEGK